MPDIFQSIKDKASDPLKVLMNYPNLTVPRIIQKENILSVRKLSKCLFLIYCPEPIYISTALNEGMDIEAGEYKQIQFKKCYNCMYFDAEMFFDRYSS